MTRTDKADVVAIVAVIIAAGVIWTSRSASIPAPSPVATVLPSMPSEEPSGSTDGPTPTPPPAEESPESTAVLLNGVASWYDVGPGVYAAAGPGFRKGQVVEVCRVLGDASTSSIACARVPLVDVCACFRGTGDERLLDLSRDTVVALGLDPALGLYRVSVQVVEP